MMRFSALAVSILLALTFAPAAFAAQPSGLTRVGNYVGAKGIMIKTSLEADMVRAGIPDQCRKEAHEVLTQFVDYGWDVMPHNKPTLDILCDFKATAPGNAKGMIGKSLGQRGTVGGLRYIHFRSDIRNVQRFMLTLQERKQTSFVNRLLHLAAATPPSGAARTVPCTAQGQCGTANLRTTPLPGSAAQAFALPINARSNSQYGARARPCSTCSAFHQGQDYAASCGTPIQAAGGGEVIESQMDPASAGGARRGKGNYVRIRHDNGVVTEYFHLQTQGIARGTRVTQGQAIGRVGSTGASTGCHLHFGTRIGGRTVDPRRVLGQATNVPLTAGDANALMTTIANTSNATNLMKNYDSGGSAGAEELENDCMSGVSVACDHGEGGTEGVHDVPEEDGHGEDDGHGH